MEFHPRLWARGERQDTLRTAGEKSTTAIDLKQLHRSNRRRAPLLRRLCPMPFPGLCARNLRWHAAILRALSAQAQQRPGQAAPEQSAGPKIEMRKSAAGAGKNPAHHAGGGRRKSSVNPSRPCGLPRKGFSGMLRPARRNVILQRRTDMSRLIRWRAGFGDPTAQGSLFGSECTVALVIPFAGEGPGPSARNVSVYHGTKTSFFQDRAHVHVNQEKADGDQGHACVDEDGCITQKAKTPRKRLGVPQANPR